MTRGLDHQGNERPLIPPACDDHSVEGCRLNAKPSAALNLIEKFGRKFHVDVLDGPCIQTGEMTVRITAVAVQPSIRSIEAFDHPCRLERFQVLIDGSVTNTPASGIELFEDVPGTEMAAFDQSRSRTMRRWRLSRIERTAAEHTLKVSGLTAWGVFDVERGTTEQDFTTTP